MLVSETIFIASSISMVIFSSGYALYKTYYETTINPYGIYYDHDEIYNGT